jgi:hypothetical protein
MARFHMKQQRTKNVLHAQQHHLHACGYNLIRLFLSFSYCPHPRHMHACPELQPFIILYPSKLATWADWGCGLPWQALTLVCSGMWCIWMLCNADATPVRLHPLNQCACTSAALCECQRAALLHPAHWPGSAAAMVPEVPVCW